MAKDSLFMETTKIPPERTAAEIIALLVESGARQISQDYDGNKKLSGVFFTLEVLPGVVRAYKLPVRIDPVFKVINGRSKYLHARTENHRQDQEQAERVAWRQLYRWAQAQLALIQVGMVEAAEIFLPYMYQHETGRTMFQEFMESTQKMLPAGKAVPGENG